MGKSTVKTAFKAEGRFLGFILKDGYKIKALRLATSNGECTIKLPKELRASLHRVLTPGEWVCVAGEQKLDLKKGTLKLTAEVITPASPSASEATAFEYALPIPSASLVKPSPLTQSADASAQDNSEEQIHPAKSLNILVCKKSDCCKRGGRAVLEALEIGLDERELGDRVTIKSTGCMKRCKAGPNLVMPDKTQYTRVRPEEIPDLLDKHFQSQPVQEQHKIV
jgi:(2Fe-2S) ferredoxin